MANMHNIPVGENSSPCLISKTWEFHKNLDLPFHEEAHQVPKRLIQRNDGFKKRFEGHFDRSLKEEIKELIELVKKSGEDVGFAHNDLLIHNILFDKEKSKCLLSGTALAFAGPSYCLPFSFNTGIYSCGP